jgi:hypothetical protein
MASHCSPGVDWTSLKEPGGAYPRKCLFVYDWQLFHNNVENLAGKFTALRSLLMNPVSFSTGVFWRSRIESPVIVPPGFPLFEPDLRDWIGRNCLVHLTPAEVPLKLMDCPLIPRTGQMEMSESHEAHIAQGQ